MHMGNPFQTRIGRPGPDGAAFPVTALGDEIAVFARPGHWQRAEGDTDASVTVVVNMHAAAITPAEARRLAAALLDQANIAEEGRA